MHADAQLMQFDLLLFLLLLYDTQMALVDAVGPCLLSIYVYEVLILSCGLLRVQNVLVSRFCNRFLYRIANVQYVLARR